MTSPRVALIGYGRIAPKHLEALRLAGAEVVASCNRSEAGRQRARDEGKIPQQFSSISSLLDGARPDAVVCCASFFEIFGAAKELIPAKVPLLIEKPPGTSLGEYSELRELAERHGTPVMVGLNRRHYSVLQKAIADAGGRDAITHVDIDWSEDAAHFLSRGFSASQVAKMVFGNSLHGIDLITFVTGQVRTPQISIRRGDAPFDWVMALQGVSAHGATVSFRSTWASPGRWRLQLCSNKRRYTFAPLETCSVQESGIKEDRAILPDAADTQCKPGFLAQAQALIEMVSTRRAPPLCSLASVEPSMALAEQLTRELTS